MRKSILLFFALSLAIWFGCKHSLNSFEDESNSANNEVFSREGKTELNSTNQALINGFFDGTLTDLSGIKIASFSVSLQKGMLWFPSQPDLKNYFDGIEVLHSKWDYSDKLTSTLLENGVLEDDAHLGDDVRNAVDAALGFKSMRHRYDSLDNSTLNWRTTLPYYLAAPDACTVVSAGGDLRIGNDFYHYVDDKIIAIVHNADEATLCAVKNGGMQIYHPNLEFYDDFYGELISRTPSSPPSSSQCVRPFS